jgi:Flp pilus assembly CpaE family ATPase
MSETRTLELLKNYDIAADEFAPILQKVRDLMTDFSAIDQKFDQNGAPLTINHLPNWKK